MATCELCREDIAESARTCPHCGHDPAAAHTRWRKIDGLLGAVLILSVIGSPLGLIFAWKSWRHARKAKSATPAAA